MKTNELTCYTVPMSFFEQPDPTTLRALLEWAQTLSESVTRVRLIAPGGDAMHDIVMGRLPLIWGIQRAITPPARQ